MSFRPTTVIVIPGLDSSCPPCAHCGQETLADDQTFDCPDCGISWDVAEPDASGYLTEFRGPTCGAWSLIKPETAAGKSMSVTCWFPPCVLAKDHRTEEHWHPEQYFTTRIAVAS